MQLAKQKIIFESMNLMVACVEALIVNDDSQSNSIMIGRTVFVQVGVVVIKANKILKVLQLKPESCYLNLNVDYNE